MKVPTARSRPDRDSIEDFISFWGKLIGIEPILVCYPEDDPSVPSDGRIDAIYEVAGRQLHLEHTSVDFIVSGSRNKRSLDPAFQLLEEALSPISCPAYAGLSVHLALDDAKDRKRVSAAIPSLLQHVECYLKTFSSDKIPGTYVLTANGITFRLRPVCWPLGKVRPIWCGSPENFLESEALEKAITEQLTDKLKKLRRSLQINASSSSLAFLLLETNDVAAKGFLDFSAVFNRILSVQPKGSCSEVWGVRGGNTPSLIWCDFLDGQRADSAYADDPYNRTYSEIQAERHQAWSANRRSLCSNG